jgi:BlaI family transcriptional regulator, penicillinase repressor
MALPKLSKFELRIMQALWSHGASSVRDVHESFPQKKRPAYTTVQTMVYRLEIKKAVRRTKKIGNALIFEALISKHAVLNRLIDELVDLFGGHIHALIAHLIAGEKLHLEDVEAARKTLRQSRKK